MISVYLKRCPEVDEDSDSLKGDKGKSRLWGIVRRISVDAGSTREFLDDNSS